MPLPFKQAEGIVEEWNKKEDSFTYAIIENQTQALIGHATADWGWDPHMPDCAVVIDPAHQRKGFGSQAMTLLIDYLYDFSVAHNISTWVVEWNQPALAFALKMGFTNVGRLRRTNYSGGSFYDEVVFDLLRPEWKERRHAA